MRPTKYVARTTPNGGCVSSRALSSASEYCNCLPLSRRPSRCGKPLEKARDRLSLLKKPLTQQNRALMSRKRHSLRRISRGLLPKIGQLRNPQRKTRQLLILNCAILATAQHGSLILNSNSRKLIRELDTLQTQTIKAKGRIFMPTLRALRSRKRVHQADGPVRRLVHNA